MDFDLREWLLILGPVFIVGVLLHGYLRMRSGQNNIKMKLDKSFLSEPGEDVGVDDLSLLKAELPNGGARVIVHPDEADDLNLDEDVPVLMESVNVPSISALDGDAETEELPSLTSTGDLPNAEDLEETAEPEEVLAVEEPSAVVDEEPSAVVAEEPSAVVDEEPPAVEEEPIVAKAPPARMPSVEDQEPSAFEEEPPAETVASSKPEKFVVINVLALDEPFAGQQLLETLVEAGMAFGELDIFHKMDDDGSPEFSLASAVEPGVFDMTTIDTFSTPGVTMFMRVHEAPEPLQVFDEMIRVAEKISLDLNGEVMDETRSVMTPQTIEHCRQSIREFQFKHSA